LASYTFSRYPNRAVEMVPAIVVQNRKALTAKPLFAGEIVLSTMVIAGPNQHSAKRYSKPSIEMDNQKLL